MSLSLFDNDKWIMWVQGPPLLVLGAHMIAWPEGSRVASIAMGTAMVLTGVASFAALVWACRTEERWRRDSERARDKVRPFLP